MKKITSKSILLFAIFALFFQSFAQKAMAKEEVKSTGSTRRIPTPEELSNQARARTPEARKNAENVIKSAKNLGANSDAALSMYQLKYSRQLLSEKGNQFGVAYPKATKTEALKLLKDLLNDYNHALSEVEQISKSSVAFSEDDKNKIEDYKTEYIAIIKKFAAEIKKEQ